MGEELGTLHEVLGRLGHGGTAAGVGAALRRATRRGREWSATSMPAARRKEYVKVDLTYFPFIVSVRKMDPFTLDFGV